MRDFIQAPERLNCDDFLEAWLIFAFDVQNRSELSHPEHTTGLFGERLEMDTTANSFKA